MKKLVLIATLVCGVVLSGCTGGEGTTTADATSPALSPAESPADSSPDETASPAAGDSDVASLVEDLEACLNDGGIETEAEDPAPPLYGEKARIALTFEYPQIIAPDAVTLWVYDSPEAAEKGKNEIDEDLLEGDTETLLRGQVVVDDFGNTLETPEAADQAEVVESCTSPS